ncbi:MAG: hypothetical protein KatS3mg097_361 [Candidatus Parcubacteria bacterium]|nr:MAG: hypothetical protein KatS3mg097_361 [Candidatus Parcubacteria bacterium]
MLRLISQFDNEKIRVSSSTPTCGPCACCSCCCSCLISTLAVLHITGRNLSNLVKKQQLEKATPSIEVKETKSAYLFGFFMLLIVSLLAVTTGAVIIITLSAIITIIENGKYLLTPDIFYGTSLYATAIIVLLLLIKFIKLSLHGFNEKYDFFKTTKLSTLIKIIINNIGLLALAGTIEFFATGFFIGLLLFNLTLLERYIIISLISIISIAIIGFIYITINFILKNRHFKSNGNDEVKIY